MNCFGIQQLEKQCCKPLKVLILALGMTNIREA